jgi:hypothetical protein
MVRVHTWDVTTRYGSEGMSSMNGKESTNEEEPMNGDESMAEMKR